MAKISTASASPSQRQSGPGFEGIGADLGGGWTAGVSRMDVDLDAADLYTGLPGDACPLEHLGYVIKGKFFVTWPDGVEEVFEAGDAFHILPGHKPRYVAGLEVVDFTRTEDAEPVMAHLQSRAAEMMARMEAALAAQK